MRAADVSDGVLLRGLDREADDLPPLPPLPPLHSPRPEEAMKAHDCPQCPHHKDSSVKKIPTDKEMLDWLARRSSGFRVTHAPGLKWFCVEADGKDSGGNTFRAAIRAAMSKRGSK